MEVLDLAYLIQVELIEQVALTEMTLAPHLKEDAKVSTPDQAVAEFDEWLMTQPVNELTNTADMELAQLIRGK